jgi:hypothetical protein
MKDNMQIGHVRRLIAATGASIAVVLAAVGCAPGNHKAAPSAAVAATTPAATPAPAPAPLSCTAAVTRTHPAEGSKVGVSVSTAPNVRVTVVAHFPADNRKKTARAGSTGLHNFWFHIGSATAGYRVRVDVRVSARGRKRSCRAAFTPRQPPPPPAPTPSPTPTAAAAPPPQHHSGAWCSASVHSFMDYDHDEWLNDVYVHSNQPDEDATASGGGDSWSYYTNSSGYADIYLNGPPPGTLITVTVGGATCTTSD